jgi:hypothetical protein
MQAINNTASDPLARVLSQVVRPPTHVAVLNGHRIEFADADYEEALADLVQKHGPGVPKVEALVPGKRMLPAGTALEVVSGNGATTKVSTPVNIAVGQYDAAGDARSQRDREAAVAAGFSPRQPVYRQGLRADGMQKHRAKFDKLPNARDAAQRLIDQVIREQRDQVEFAAVSTRVNDKGRLALGRGRRLLFTERSFASLVARLDMPDGAASYLPEIDPELRALNMNHWIAGPFAFAEDKRLEEKRREGKKAEPKQLTFRTRLAGGYDPEAHPGDRECFAVVSGKYGEFDADEIARAVKMATPADARARVTYDGFRTKIDVIFFSNIEPKHAVAGEFFQAAVQIRSDDAGGGSIVVSAALHQNLCLNFIILDKAVGEVARIRHVGSTEELAKKFTEAFEAALKKIEHFTQAWGYAQEEDAAARALATAKQTGAITAEELDAYVVRPVSEVLPGIFNGLIERELVPVSKRNRAETVQQLMTMWERDESAATRQRDTFLTRAAVVNAVTRYAHEVNEDPFLESELEAAGGALLFGKDGAAPGPLPFVPLPAPKA